MDADQEGRIAAITLSGEFPTLARIVEKDIDFNLESFFEFGLHRLLDGADALNRRPNRRMRTART